MAQRWNKGLAALGGMMLLVAGCGGGGDAVVASASSSSVPAAPAPTWNGPETETEAPAPAPGPAPAPSIAPAPASAPTPAPAPSPAISAPTVSLGYQAKGYSLQWNASASATQYDVLEDPDGAGPQPAVQVASAITGTTDLVQPAALLPDRLNATYTVRACNAAGCSAPSAAIAPDANRAIGYFKASNTGMGDRFGETVALSADGSTMVVGATGEASGNGDPADDSALYAGAVYVFVRTATGWAQQAYLKSPAPFAQAAFGRGLAISADGNTVVVGEPADGASSPGGVANNGTAYVFKRTGAAWSQQARLGAYPLLNGSFGERVAISADGQTIAVSATTDASSASGISTSPIPGSGPAAGAVHVFVQQGSAWAQQAYIKGPHPAAFDNFGRGVALSADGDRLAVGSPGMFFNSSGQDTEAVFVYQRSAGAWALQQTVRMPGGAFQAFDFGSSVSLSGDGDTLAVGASGVSDVSWSGSAHVFAFRGGTWTSKAELMPRSGGNFGISVSLSADGAMLAVGARADTESGLGINPVRAFGSTQTGAVYLFAADDSGWPLRAYLKASNASRYLGQSVALSGNGRYLASGGFDESSNATGVQGDQSNTSMPSSGAVYLY